MLNRSASLAMSTSILKALPGELDIKRLSPSILYVFVYLGCQTWYLKNVQQREETSVWRHTRSLLCDNQLLVSSICTPPRENLSHGFPTE